MENTKVIRNSHREVTHLSRELTSQLRSADFLYNSLSAGSKNLLRQYQTNLSVTRGNHRPEFDKQLKAVLKQYVYSDIHMTSELHYLEDLVDEDGVTFRRNYKLYSKVDEQMKRFTARPYTSFRWNKNYQLALNELRKTFQGLSLRPLQYTCDEDILQALPKTDTHSGYTYIETGIKEKGGNMEGIFNKYQDAVKRAFDEGSFNRPIMISFRTQASGEYDQSGQRTNTCKLKTRVVSMCDLILLIAELRFMKPIQELLASVSWYTGGKDRNDISSIISDSRSKFNWWLSIDYSSFDQTLPPWLIEDVWSVFAEALNLTAEDKRLLEIVVHDTIHKDFILNEGVAHSDVGLPSGYNFTNAGGSACNRVVWLTYAFAKGLQSKMIACGDDNLIFTRDQVNLEDMASYIGKNFGMVVSAAKTQAGNAKRDNPLFLSCEWRPDGQYRNPKLLLSRLLYPERHRNYDEIVTPEIVLYAYILTYRLGMEKLMDVGKFMYDNQFISTKDLLGLVDTHLMPGAFQFMRHYT